MSNWPRRPSARWPDAKAEDEFECLQCKDWKPWFCYGRTFHFLFAHAWNEDEYTQWVNFHNDPVASKTHRFAFNFCTEQAVRDSGAYAIQA